MTKRQKRLFTWRTHVAINIVLLMVLGVTFLSGGQGDMPPMIGAVAILSFMAMLFTLRGDGAEMNYMVWEFVRVANKLRADGVAIEDVSYSEGFNWYEWGPFRFRSHEIFFVDNEGQAVQIANLFYSPRNPNNGQGCNVWLEPGPWMQSLPDAFEELLRRTKSQHGGDLTRSAIKNSLKEAQRQNRLADQASAFFQGAH